MARYKYIGDDRAQLELLGRLLHLRPGDVVRDDSDDLCTHPDFVRAHDSGTDDEETRPWE